MLRCSILPVAGALLMLSTAAHAATITFATDPFEGSDALTTPGRQIVGGEPFITFDIGADVFAFEPSVFGITQLDFANDVAGNLPSSGVNFIVLQTFDDDANPATPFGAGTAANVIANQITTSAPGFFIYFNSGLDLARLVFSTDLSDNTADLKILARLTNLAGQPGRDAFPSFTDDNVDLAAVPEPTSMLLVASGLAWIGRSAFRRGRTTATGPAPSNRA